MAKNPLPNCLDQLLERRNVEVQLKWHALAASYEEVHSCVGGREVGAEQAAQLFLDIALGSRVVEYTKSLILCIPGAGG